MSETPTVDAGTRRWRSGWMIAASLAALAIIASLVNPLHFGKGSTTSRAHSFLPPGEAVHVSGPREIFVDKRTPLAAHLELLSVAKQKVTYPLLTVTGSVVARIRAGSEPLPARWQFAGAELASDYADWLKADADIEFNQRQLEATRTLVAAQIERYEKVVEHLKLVAKEIAGKELRTAEADLVQSKLQGQKDIFAADTAVRLARRQKTTLERRLAQSGVEPDVLLRAREGMVLISANVPEAKISMVYDGQACEARFFSMTDRVFSAHVEELGSVLSTSRRTMRVLFDLDDAEDLLKPGMFAEVGLGTNAREALLIPTSAVLHIGSADYVFKEAKDAEHFEVAEVQISESRGGKVEVRSGLAEGDRIAGNEAVLLKPLAVQSLAQ